MRAALRLSRGAARRALRRPGALHRRRGVRLRAARDRLPASAPLFPHAPRSSASPMPATGCMPTSPQRCCAGCSDWLDRGRAPPPPRLTIRLTKHRRPTMTDNLREAALDYHRFPTPGKISVTPTKPMATQRDLALAYSPGVADACMEIARDPAEAMQPDLARQPGGRHHQRHRGAGPGQHRPAGRQAGDGRQGLPVQEVRRHRRVRHRARRERPRRADRHHRAHGAHLRRHQPRGHQGARVLLHREEAARAHEDPGLPRRPARHRHRRGRGHPQRAAARRQGHRARSSSWPPAPAPRRWPAWT